MLADERSWSQHHATPGLLYAAFNGFVEDCSSRCLLQGCCSQRLTTASSACNALHCGGVASPCVKVFYIGISASPYSPRCRFVRKSTVSFLLFFFITTRAHDAPFRKLRLENQETITDKRENLLFSSWQCPLDVETPKEDGPPKHPHMEDYLSCRCQAKAKNRPFLN